MVVQLPYQHDLGPAQFLIPLSDKLVLIDAFHLDKVMQVSDERKPRRRRQLVHVILQTITQPGERKVERHRRTHGQKPHHETAHTRKRKPPTKLTTSGATTISNRTQIDGKAQLGYVIVSGLLDGVINSVCQLYVRR